MIIQAKKSNQHTGNKMKKQFENVNSSRGAPMGRACFGTPDHAENKIRVFRVRLDSGGYDDGGAYWGFGQSLYCATDGGDYRQFTRANGRLSAIAQFEIKRGQLAKPPIKEFQTMAALRGNNGEHLSDRGKALFFSLQELGFK